jgi:hypothetical protein
MGDNQRITGPAIVDEVGSTTFVPTGVTAYVDMHLNLILERGTAT